MLNDNGDQGQQTRVSKEKRLHMESSVHGGGISTVKYMAVLRYIADTTWCSGGRNVEHELRAERWLGGSILASFVLIPTAFRVTFMAGG